MLPPGQYEVEKLKVLNFSSIPEVDVGDYTLRITGKVERALRLSYDDLRSMNQAELRIPAHCVEGWSVADLKWEGVLAEEIISISNPEKSEYALLKSLDGYSTAVPFEYFERGILALKMNGKTIPPGHGFPVRAVIPDLYFWKSAKWLCEIEFLDSYMDGFWEKRGYHEVGDVWLEQRKK